MINFAHCGAGLAFHQDVVEDFEVFQFVRVDFFDHVTDHSTTTLEVDNVVHVEEIVVPE